MTFSVRTPAHDEVGNLIRLGDLVRVHPLEGHFEVEGFLGTTLVAWSLAARRRVQVDSADARVVTPVDGRPLRTWQDECKEAV